MFDYKTLKIEGYASRGIRNNNPGNLENSPSNKWKGLATPEQMTDEQRSESRFCVFVDPRYGIRALAKLLMAYQKKYKLTNITMIFNRYAPRQDNNDTRAYAAAVAQAVGVSPTATISVRDHDTLRKMIMAIIQHENGMQPYPDEIITDGIAMAGIDMPGETADEVKPASKSRETIAAAGGVTATGALIATEIMKWLNVQPELAGVLSDAVAKGVTAAANVGNSVQWIDMIQLGLTGIIAIAALDWFLNRRLSASLGLR